MIAVVRSIDFETLTLALGTATEMMCLSRRSFLSFSFLYGLDTAKEVALETVLS